MFILIISGWREHKCCLFCFSNSFLYFSVFFWFSTLNMYYFYNQKKNNQNTILCFFSSPSSCLHTECFKSSSEAQRFLSTLTLCLNLLLVFFSFLFDYANIGMSQNLPITWALSSVGIWAECKEQIKRTAASFCLVPSDTFWLPSLYFPSLILFSPRKKMLIDVDIKTTSLKEIWRKGIGLYIISPWICTTLLNYCLRKIPAQLVCYCADQSKNWEELRLERGLKRPGIVTLETEKRQDPRRQKWGRASRTCVCDGGTVEGGRIVSWLWGEWMGQWWVEEGDVRLSVENIL